MSQTTKKALAESLKKLMNATPLVKITVNDIVKDCGVNRRTFYYHFKDVYDLLEWIFKNEVSNVMAENKTYNTWQQGFLRIFFYLSENRKIVLNTYNSIGLVITSKENSWLQSHEFTTWFGRRTKMMRKRFYSEKSIHGIFYCDITERLLNIHTAIIDKFYENFKPFILKAYSSIICHPI